MNNHLPVKSTTPTNNLPGLDVFSQFVERQIKHFRAYEQPNADGGTLFQFYINGEIIGSEYYIDMIQAIRMCAANDKVFIYLNSEGGHVDTGLQIINAINECNGEVITVLDSKAYSIAAVIFLAGHTRIVHKQGSLMVHNYSAGLYGKGNELVAQLNGYNQYILSLFKDHMFPFLTEEEIEHVINGRDYWMSSAEVQERLEKINQMEQRANIEQEIEAYTEARNEIDNQLKMLKDALAEAKKLEEPKPTKAPAKKAPVKKPVAPKEVPAEPKKRVPPTVRDK